MNDAIEKNRIEIESQLMEIQQMIEPRKILNFSELINKDFPDIPWDVEGIFESGTINMISAPPNQYKSWIVQHVALCLAQGKNVFGEFKTKTQKVLIVNEEDNLRMIKDRSLKMIDELKNLDIYFMVGSGFKIGLGTTMDILSEARQRNVTFIVFDSLRSIHNANENDSQEMQEVMDCFKELTREGITVLFTHHNRKKDKFANKTDNSGEESRGSTAINAAVHGHISCEEIFKEDGKYLLISQRKLKCDEKIPPFSVKINIDKENDKMDFIYTGEYDAKDDTFRKNKESSLRFIENSDRWLSKKEIGGSLKIGTSALNNVLRELEAEGFVESKTKKDLEKAGTRINDQETKHNAKFYFRKDAAHLPPEELFDEIPIEDEYQPEF